MSLRLSGTGSYIEASTTTAPTNPVSGKVRLYAKTTTNLSILDTNGVETTLGDAFLDDEILMDF